jgi:hypothetical protein
MDVFALLLDHGADSSEMLWGSLHRAVALGSLEEVQVAADCAAFSARDVSGLTPFLLACDIGDVDKAAALLPLSKQEDRYRTRNREPALMVAADKRRGPMVRWLLAKGFDANETDEFGGTALITAAEVNSVEIVKDLLESGADIGASFNLSASVRNIDRSRLGMDPLSQDLESTGREHFQTAASNTRSAAVARLLIEAGAKPHEFENDVLRDLTGASLMQEQQITRAIYEAQKNRRFGTQNPEPVAYEFWLEMVRSGKSEFGANNISGPAIWSFDRFGMSTTELPGNVWVQIAGEHEDHYDPDFCIYNDVILHKGGGDTQIYIYPREVFPPTDFHTATLVDDAIILIGSLGYYENRPVGRTQVLSLNLKDFSIDRIESSGELPGWISRHQARLDGDKITVWGGDVWDGADLVPMDGAYRLSLASGIWQKVDSE